VKALLPPLKVGAVGVPRLPTVTVIEVLGDCAQPPLLGNSVQMAWYVVV
jgi:hypothetical protein